MRILRAQEVSMDVTTNQVQRVMRASVWARRFTTCSMVLMVAGLIWAVLAVVTAPLLGGTAKIGPYAFTAAEMQSWSVKSWVLLFIAPVAALGLTFVYLLRSIFSNLARGEIFCHPNVRHIRGLGLLIIAGGALKVLAPFLTAIYFMVVGYDKIAHHEVGQNAIFSFDVIEPFAYGGMLILLSWIMAVGLGVREDAEKLRHDAELVI
jgi:hypothetical protein